MRSKIKFIFKYKSVNQVLLAVEVAEYLEGSGFADSGRVFINSESHKISEIPEVVEMRGLPCFSINDGFHEFSMGRNAFNQIDALTISVKEPLGTDAWRLIYHEFRQFGDLLSAAVVDFEYDYWQNIQVPAQVRLRGGNLDDYEVLVTSEGEEYIDRSRNPGRSIVRSGYVETMGGIIWISKDLLTLTGGNLENVESFSLEGFDSDGCIEIILDENLLAEAEGDEEMARKQDELRAALFPQSLDESTI